MQAHHASDRTISLLWAVLAHIAIIAALVISARTLVKNEEVKRFGQVMEVAIVDLTKMPTPTKPRAAKPTPKPVAPRPKPSTTELERPQVKPAAITPPQPELASTLPKPDVAPEPKPVENKPAQEAETRRQRDLDAEQKRAEAARLAEMIQREQEIDRANEILNQEVASNPPEGEVLDDLRAQYAAAITAAIQSGWLRPSSAMSGVQCNIRVRQLTGGEVISVSIMDGCFQDEPTQASLIAAVNRASPLPYDGFESVYNPDLIIPFIPED
jgi:colicin import membrane protein